jgi:hypothetical protein
MQLAAREGAWLPNAVTESGKENRAETDLKLSRNSVKTRGNAEARTGSPPAMDTDLANGGQFLTATKNRLLA